ncbi:MAG: hypothetical protein NWR72_06400 [Bacteroidia bacterium]|nr:hypothetical protein [Bacteroidia bacterium]
MNKQNFIPLCFLMLSFSFSYAGAISQAEIAKNAQTQSWKGGFSENHSTSPTIEQQVILPLRQRLAQQKLNKLLKPDKQTKDGNNDYNAIVSLVAGSVGLFFGFMGLLFFPFSIISLAAGVVAIIIGHKAKKNGEDKTLSKVGIVFGVLSVVGSVLFLGLIALLIAITI